MEAGGRPRWHRGIYPCGVPLDASGGSGNSGSRIARGYSASCTKRSLCYRVWLSRLTIYQPIVGHLGSIGLMPMSIARMPAKRC